MHDCASTRILDSNVMVPMMLRILHPYIFIQLKHLFHTFLHIIMIAHMRNAPCNVVQVHVLTPSRSSL